MRFSLPLLAAGAAGALTLIPPADAAACTCGMSGYILPAGGTQVPTNTRIWIQLHEGNGRTIELEAEDGTKIGATAQSVLDGASVGVFVPERQLAPGTTYTVNHESGISVSFRTGAGPDFDPPARPILREVDSGVAGRGDTCESTFVAFSSGSEADLVLLDVGGEASFDPATLAGRVSDLQSGDPDYLFVGRSICHASWPGAAPGRSTTVRAIALDLAGNASAWSPTVTAKVPDDASGCSAGAAGASLLGLFAAASALRRR
jgi:hypothetical protein